MQVPAAAPPDSASNAVAVYPKMPVPGTPVQSTLNDVVLSGAALTEVGASGTLACAAGTTMKGTVTPMATVITHPRQFTNASLARVAPSITLDGLGSGHLYRPRM